MNHKKIDPDQVESLRLEAVQHLHFVIGLYRIQVEGGRHFLHGHPETASSCRDPWMLRLLEHPKIKPVVSDHASMDY